MKERSLTISFLTLIALVAVAGCSDNPVGRKCFLGTDAGANQSIVSSPALECSSRQCLHVPQERDLPEGSEHTALCTADCDSDSDCDRVPESPCQLGFTCAVAVTTGPFCCRKLCICRDYVVVPDGGLLDPAACEPTAANQARCGNI
jgi:hypothetical protein